MWSMGEALPPYSSGRYLSSVGSAARASIISRSAATRESFCARLKSARDARATVWSVSAISRHGLTVTDSSTPMV